MSATARHHHSDAHASDELLMEVQAIGGFLVVSVMHAPSLEEIRFQAPAGMTTSELGRIARQRMNSHLRKHGRKNC